MKILANLWVKNLRYRWSRLRHIMSPIKTSVRPDLRPQTARSVKRVAEKLIERFIYTPDGVTRLFDSIDTPAGAWERAWSPRYLRDDCDGFHAALYWAVHFHLPCYLLTIVTADIRKSHTLLCFEDSGLYYIDYTYMTAFENIMEAVEHIKNRRNMGTVITTEKSVWDKNMWKSKECYSGSRRKRL